MTDNWKSYFCNVNEKLASVFINLSLRNEAPILSKPWLLWVWVHFQAPRGDGLSDGKEAPTLFKIEELLAAHIGRQCQAIPCGRITTEGRREFYFYGETKEGLAAAVQAARSDFREYKFDLGDQEDSLWEHYLNVLYPSAQDLERIKNRDLLGVLAEQGDVPGAAREVQHWMYFPSDETRALFRHEASKDGFKIESESHVDGDRPFGISVIRKQSVEKELIDATVVELLRLVERFQGEYDGWETPVITQ
jgi:regulator of RNase E activity RraB